MLIDFDKLDETRISRFRGGEKELAAKIFTDEQNKIMLGCLEPGASIGMHIHDTSSETIYLLAGRGKVIYDGETEVLSAGSCHYCPKGHAHSLINDSDAPLTFFAVVPEHENDGHCI